MIKKKKQTLTQFLCFVFFFLQVKQLDSSGEQIFNEKKQAEHYVTKRLSSDSSSDEDDKTSETPRNISIFMKHKLNQNTTGVVEEKDKVSLKIHW